MKGLLLKEFYIWLRTRSWILIYIIAINILFISTNKAPMSVAGIGILMGSVFSSFLTDEKSNWPNYGKALPCTPFERVSAKYIIHFSELLIGVIAYTVFNTLSTNELLSKETFLITPGTSQSYAETALMIAAFILFFAIELPIGFRFKGTLRTVLGILSMFIFLALWLKIMFSALNGELIVFSEKKHLTVMLIIASLVLLAASWALSVVIETGQSGKYKNKFRNAAIVLIVIAVAVGSASAVMYYNSIENSTAEQSGKYESLDNVETATQEINKYYDSFCDGLLIGTKTYDYVLALEDAGYIQDEKFTDIYYSESGNIMIDIGVSYPSEDKIGRVDITCKHATKSFESATYASFKNLKMNFNKGMTESELHAKFNELEIIPREIEETTFNNTDRTRRYTFEFITADFEDEKGSVEYNLMIDTDGEKVTEVDDLMMHMQHDSPVPVDPEETPLEIASRSAADYLQQLCDENNIEKTPREFIRDLRNMGYTESEEIYDLYYSEGGKVSVSLVTDENDELEKITAIPNYGEMKYIESATDEDLNKLTADFTNGMTESQFIGKLIEIDMLPDIITEEYGEGDKHTRIYEFRYRIGDYNGDGALTYSITVTVTDGTVTEIIAL